MRRLRRLAVLGGVPICVATALSGGALVASAASTAAQAATARPASVSPGSDIGNAGVLTSTGAGTITSSSDDWWVIYPSTPGQTVTVSVRNSAKSGTSCAVITATLLGTNGASQFINNANVSPSSSGQVTGQGPGSDRYYVEVTPNGCSSSAPYRLTLKSGGGGTPPSPVSRSVSPGAGIGSAWPPLLGHSSYGASINFNGGTENWYVLYKKPDTHVASIRIENTTVSGSTSCAVFTALLFTNSGTAGFLTSTSLNNNAANTLSVPARQAGDPQGLLYLEVTADGFDCGTGGANYRIEPEPGIEFANPARIATGKSTPAQSIGGPWPPLHGGLSYRGSIDFSGGTENWYVLYKKPDTHVASIRVANTTVDGSTSCAVFTVSLFTNAGTNGELVSTALNNNAATTLSVPANQSGDPHGLFYLKITADGFDCGAGGANYTIEPEPQAEFLSPAKVPAGKATPGSSPRRAWPPLAGGRSFKGSIDFSGGTQNWYVLDKRPSNHPGSVRVTNTTVDGSTSCAVFTVNLNTNAGLNLDSFSLNNNASTTLSVPAHQAGDPQGSFYLEITADGFDCGTGGATYTIEPEPKTQFASPALKVASTTLKKGKVRRAYKAAIGVSEGRAPYSFIAKTKLPPGLQLNRRTGVISGRPTRRGRFSFKVEIIDSSRPRHKSVTDTFKITIT